jgi:hypothetical protein
MKILCFLNTRASAVNFIESGVVDHLNTVFNLSIAAPKDLEIFITQNVKSKLSFFQITDNYKYQYIFHYLCFKLKNARSPLYKVMKLQYPLPSLRIIYFTYHILFKTNKIDFSFLTKAKINKYVRKIILYLISRKILNRFFDRIILRIPENFDLLEIIRSNNPNLVVIPTVGNNIYDCMVSQYCRELGVNTLFLAENWDNCVQNVLFWNKPNYLGTFSAQSARHFIEYQGFSQDELIIIGSSRMNIYFENHSKVLPSFRYVLFVGSEFSCNFDELIEIASRNLPADIKLVYRPYPRKKFEPPVILKNLSNIIFDDGKLFIDESIKNSHDYLMCLLQNAILVFGAPSTLILECAVLKKYFLMLTFDQFLVKDAPLAIFEYFPHYKGLEKIHYAIRCDNEELFIHEFSAKLNTTPKSINYFENEPLKDFLFQNPDGYKNHLTNVIQDLIK